MTLTAAACVQEGGWTRQTTIRELPTSVELAGVNMRLEEGVIRELHWHKEAEWAYGEQLLFATLMLRMVLTLRC